MHEVRLQKCRGVLSALNILEHEDPAIAFYLCDKLKRVVFVTGDYVIREGQEAAGMYFISSGLVEVVSKRTGDEAITTLSSGSFFGEMALLNPTGEATASIVVRTYLEGCAPRHAHAVRPLCTSAFPVPQPRRRPDPESNARGNSCACVRLPARVPARVPDRLLAATCSPRWTMHGSSGTIQSSATTCNRPRACA